MDLAFATIDEALAHAIALAERGIGHVEPNPPVGAVLLDRNLQCIGEGFHQRFGGAHAEVEAIADTRRRFGNRAADLLRQATLCVTLEPCAHFGKTPPCTDAILQAAIPRVVVGCVDPSPHAAGRGIERLRDAGVEVTVLDAPSARELIEPFAKRVTTGRPFVLVKWAMTLDGRIATRTGHSQWISSETSRQRVHTLRGRVDAVVVGIGTVLKDDPLLTARPPGPRRALRVVLDTHARLPLDSRLVRTAAEWPVMAAVGPTADEDHIRRLRHCGVEVLVLPLEEQTAVASPGSDRFDECRRDAPSAAGHVSLAALLDEFGRRDFTNVLFEGGAHVFGALADARLIDEWHVFIAPKIVGGDGALPPVLGRGRERVPERPSLRSMRVECLGSDLYVTGRTVTGH
ncbi:MAG: bifunctional diaminohydroxyphosphoribosylaminopyrimidine deaminase/5-amino-6-(5-phosphoribosylamino)uracil reductase RibD [Planctomycetota bacterium]|nr:MAG: bifunctional diaminohydroxyphosphoribosylaminopyrimidine deaminase/5-amino-6-(5-phosphoribosylamino)uracil reductase RibD [Planctomycetota bacterium]